MRSRRWLLWLFLFVAVFFAVSVLGTYLFFRSLSAAPSFAQGTTLSIELEGELPEDTFFDLSGPFFEIDQPTLSDVLFSLEQARSDPRIENLVMHVRGVGIGWARAEELRSALVDFKTSGKALFAYVEYGSSLDYFVATAADRIYLHPQTVLDLRGLRSEVTFIKSMLDKLGIEAEFEQIGAYKNAPETFTREEMSRAHRESLQSLVDDFYEHLTTTIAEARGLEIDRVRSILDRGPFPASRAREEGLVDGLHYLDEVHEELAPAGDEFASVKVTGYRKATRPTLVLDGRPKIALVYGLGAIMAGDSNQDGLFGRTMGSDTLAASFREVREDSSVKAVVFRIDSPGGTDVASDVIWREASLTKAEKPVVVSMGDVAASGGYWIAMASSAIVAQPTTITGSIGVFGGKLNLAGLYETIGVHQEGVSRGESADFWSDNRSFTPEERARFREILEVGYGRFLEKVAEGRDMTTEEVDEVAQGRVWTGSQALDRGLVDELGGLDRAIELAREKAEIAEGTRVQIVIYPKKRSFVELVLRKMATEARLAAWWRLPTPRALLERSPFLRAMMQGRPLAMMPFELTLR